MKMPNRENAYIPLSKLKDYLLSEEHAVGRSKAKFLRAFGVDATNIELLEHGLLKIAKAQDVNEEESSPYGTKYVVDGSLQTPIGNFINLRTVWIIEKGQNRPRFVTAIPK